jgi:hypothetical protein
MGPCRSTRNSKATLLAWIGHKSFQELTIGQAAQNSSSEQTPELDEIKTRGWSSCHDIHSPTTILHLPVVSQSTSRRFRILDLFSAG